MKPVDEEQELARLLASEASPLGASLSALRERGPDATELGLLASRLSLRGIAASVPPKPPAAAPKPWKPWLLAGGGGAALGLLWLALRGAAPAQVQGSDAEAQARAQATEAQRSHDAPSTPEARGNGSGKPTPSGAALEPPAVDTPVPDEAAPPAAATNTETPPPASATLRPPASAAAPDGATPSGALRTSQPASGGSPAPGPSGVLGAPSEIELLRDARLALRQSPAAALAFAEQHARVYPQGKLSQERELIAISALVASGRRTAALSRGARFEQAFPTSPYRKQLGELLK
ncbi:MAG TPA: hypothetical protein VHP33_34510 [Polyangiaceae bacterium]|nr:hypothetical protein [Polyangiaceae bacterium]